jgi:hypothetical protein
MESQQPKRHLDKPKMKKKNRKTYRHWDNPEIEMMSWVSYYCHIWIQLEFGWIEGASQSGSEQPDSNWDGLCFGTQALQFSPNQSNYLADWDGSDCIFMT